MPQLSEDGSGSGRGSPKECDVAKLQAGAGVYLPYLQRMLVYRLSGKGAAKHVNEIRISTENADRER